MKVCICLTFIAAVLFLQVAEAAVLHHDHVDLETAARMILHNFQRVMPCGVPELSVPILAPFHVDYIAINNSNSVFNNSGYLSNLYINGLDDAQILALNYDNETTRFNFDIRFHEIQVLAEYKIDNKVYLNSLPLQFSGIGLLNNKLVGLRFVAECYLAAVGKDGNGLKIEDFHLNFYLENAAVNNLNHNWDNDLNNFVNRFLSEGLLTWVRQVQERLDGYAASFLPIVNEKLLKLSKKAVISKLLDLIILLEMTECTKA